MNTDKAKRRNYRDEYLAASEEARQSRDTVMFGKPKKSTANLEKKADALLAAQRAEKELRDVNAHKKWSKE